ncbi:hypothetical protein CPB84DRAFT_1770891 [Gymnopilus junonius]|uniref:Uncharacterized protein n=1 Tax=Gymnopilus junonius TaxID=109634 RepID=A0A9P5TPU9_GYMJU|nr:hypothetical protein CPB84DRAFT_1770891 [Gymnopilus junonius]
MAIPKPLSASSRIGAVWDICQRHFDNSAWSQSSVFDDDDIPLDEDALYEFYMFMFSETLFGRYSRARGQRYRYEHSGARFSAFADSEEPHGRHARNITRQRKESEEYEKGLQELGYSHFLVQVLHY